ncbi:hypothetical protein ABK040_001125 [Willaertia magna]
MLSSSNEQSITSTSEETTEKQVAESVDGYVIFIRNIDNEVEEDELFQLFSDYGYIKSLHYNLSRRSGVPLGFCMVKYETKEEGERAINEMNNKLFKKRKLEVDWAFIQSTITVSNSSPSFSNLPSESTTQRHLEDTTITKKRSTQNKSKSEHYEKKEEPPLKKNK